MNKNYKTHEEYQGWESTDQEMWNSHLSNLKTCDPKCFLKRVAEIVQREKGTDKIRAENGKIDKRKS